MASIFRRPISHAKPQAQNKGMREDLPSKWTAKKAVGANLVSDKTDFKLTKMKKDKEGHYIVVTGSMQKGLAILNIYAPNAGIYRFRKQVLRDLQSYLDS